MPAAINTPLTDLLGCRYPIVQTAMGWVATSRLVIATSNAGGFGFLAAATMSTDELASEIEAVKKATSARFGVNFHMFQPGAGEIVDLILANRDQVRAVSFGRGPDAKMISRFRDAGILCVPTVGAVKHAKKMVELGVDMVTVQGGEGGGHTGAVATTVLLPQVLDAVKVPVIAAGGFADGRGLAAALAYGAVGIAMGTRFLLTKESPVLDSVKQRYLGAKVTDAVVTTVIDGVPQRVLMGGPVRDLERANALTRYVQATRNALAFQRLSGTKWSDMVREGLAMKRSHDLSWSQVVMAANAPMLYRAGLHEGREDVGVTASGQVVGLIEDIPSCAELIDRIVAEAAAVLLTEDERDR